jgi:uncharacterized delta-60 repeat protein
LTLKSTMAAAAVASAALVSLGATQPAFAAAGGLDPTFGTGGTVLTTNLPVGVVNDAVLQPNGDIIVGGSSGLVRYLPNGRVDTSFGTNGLAQTSFSVNGLAIQPNGEFVTAGGANGDFTVARFTTSGSLDPAFGTGGVVNTPFPKAADGASADAVLVEPNGDILAGGQASLPGPSYHQPIVVQGALARYNPNGTLDSVFGTGGIVQSPAITSNITNLGLDTAGDIFVLPAHAEFSPAGQLDSSVTPAAITASSHGGTSEFLPTGQSLMATIVGFGHGQYKAQVQRFNADGSLDPAFSNPPFTYTGSPFASHDSPGGIAVQADGKVVVVGAHFQGTSVFGAARLNPGGSLDSGFGTAGVLTTNFQGNDIARAVLIQPNGDILAIGNSANNQTGVGGAALARYLP